jgi:hypothetical protein
MVKVLHMKKRMVSRAGRQVSMTIPDVELTVA